MGELGTRLQGTGLLKVSPLIFIINYFVALLLSTLFQNIYDIYLYKNCLVYKCVYVREIY